MRGIFHIIIGGVFVAGGLSGNMVMRGTSSSGAIAVVGLVLIGLGVYRLVQDKQAQPPE